MGDKNPNKQKKKKKKAVQNPVIEVDINEPILIKKVKKQK